MKAVIYARVSPTKHIKTVNDMHQSLEEAVNMCRNDAAHENNEIINEYIDQYVSGKSSKHMLAFQTMMKDARDHKFDRIYCRRVNRFGRNRADMITSEIELTGLGISIKFVENGIDTSKPFGKSIMAILADLAEQERLEILNNTQRGREEYKLNGGVFGQPKKDIDVESLRQMRLMPINKRPTWKALSKLYRASPSTLIDRLKDAGYWDYDKRTVV